MAAMYRNRFLLGLCGVGIAALLTPLAALAPTMGGTGTGGTGGTGSGASGVQTPGTGLAQGVGNTGPAEGVKPLVALTTKTPLYAANSGSTGSATSIPSNANFMVNNYVLYN